jgi:hypothetical protein
MSHNNRLSRTDEQDWRDTLAAPEPLDQDPGEPATPDPPWPAKSDVEFVDALQDQGRLGRRP